MKSSGMLPQILGAGLIAIPFASDTIIRLRAMGVLESGNYGVVDSGLPVEYVWTTFIAGTAMFVAGFCVSHFKK